MAARGAGAAGGDAFDPMPIVENGEVRLRLRRVCHFSVGDTRRVRRRHQAGLMLHFFDRDVKPWSAYAKNIRAELEQQSRWPLEISDHSLMTARSNAEDSEAAFVEY